MPISDRAAFTLGELVAPVRNALVGGPFGSDLESRDYVLSGVPVIRGTNMGHGRWVEGDFAYVTVHKADSLSANCAVPGDLIFTQRGTLGQVALIPERGAERYLISQSQMKLTVDSQKADSLYLYYVFTSAEMQSYIRQNAIQTGVPHTNLGILRNSPISLPPLSTQKAIAGMLGRLDDKIELNGRMNATRGAMARALFQSWFVDFDPVRATLDGREPVNLDSATAALFPAAFRDSRLGAIPGGWDTGSILQQAELLSGGTPDTSNAAFWNGAIPWASAKDVSQCGEAMLIEAERRITSQGLNQSATKLIPEFSTVVVARGAATGRLTMFSKTMAMNQTCYGLQSKVQVPFALYCHARLFIERMVHAAHGSVFDTITTRTFESTEVLLPPVEVQLAFNSLVEPLFLKIRANLQQSRTLATLRDALLPKLLSGELRVHEIEI